MSYIIPTFKIKNDAVKNVDNFDISEIIDDVDLFYRRIVGYILNRIEDVETNNILCYIIDSTNHRQAMLLDKKGWPKAVERAMVYFEKIEEYETCDLIKQIKTTIK